MNIYALAVTCGIRILYTFINIISILLFIYIKLRRMRYITYGKCIILFFLYTSQSYSKVNATVTLSVSYFIDSYIDKISFEVNIL